MALATIEIRELKIDVEFEYSSAVYAGHPNSPNSVDAEIGEITSIKIHGTDIDITWFLEGEMNQEIEVKLWDYINDNGI